MLSIKEPAALKGFVSAKLLKKYLLPQFVSVHVLEQEVSSMRVLDFFVPVFGERIGLAVGIERRRLIVDVQKLRNKTLHDA